MASIYLEYDYVFPFAGFFLFCVKEKQPDAALAVQLILSHLIWTESRSGRLTQHFIVLLLGQVCLGL